jgi:hypothetical protein
MNSFLLNRAQGTINASAFHVTQTSRLLHLLEPSRGIRFSSKIVSFSNQRNAADFGIFDDGAVEEVVAHVAGVTVLAIDRHNGR